MNQTIESLHLRVSDLENKLQTFLSKLVRYDSSFDSLTNLSNNIGKYESKFLNIENFISEFTSKSDKNLQLLLDLGEKVRCHDINFHEIALKAASIPDINNLLMVIQKRIDLFDEKVADLIQTKFKPSDLNEVHQRIDSICKVINDTRDELKGDQKYLGEIVRQEINRFVDLHNSSLKESILNVIKDFENDKKQVTDKIEESKNAFFKETASLREELANKFNSLSQKKDEPKSAQPLDQGFLNKIESYAIDVSNAHLKINNFDLLMKIMDKKIETLSLLMKKLDLSKG